MRPVPLSLFKRNSCAKAQLKVFRPTDFLGPSNILLAWKSSTCIPQTAGSRAPPPQAQLLLQHVGSLCMCRTWKNPLPWFSASFQAAKMYTLIKVFWSFLTEMPRSGPYRLPCLHDFWQYTPWVLFQGNWRCVFYFKKNACTQNGLNMTKYEIEVNNMTQFEFVGV